ncbi:MAG TPA: RING-H2 finger protein [Rhabdochlamydiaceae bacterium]|nr:RING-H2 finger protein [Rhabdochlamydiaceae bacterium]
MTVSFISWKPEPGQSPLCAMCQCDVNEGEEGSAHKINEKVAHIFHSNCIKKYADYNPRCPLCRAEIDSINGIKVRPIPWGRIALVSPILLLLFALALPLILLLYLLSLFYGVYKAAEQCINERREAEATQVNPEIEIQMQEL